MACGIVVNTMFNRTITKTLCDKFRPVESDFNFQNIRCNTSTLDMTHK